MLAMSLGNPRKQVVVDTFEAAQDGAPDVSKQLVGCLLNRFKEFMSNPALQAEMQAQFAANNMIALLQKEGIFERAPGETSKREIPMGERESVHSLPLEQRGNEASHEGQENVQANEVPVEDRSEASSPSDEEEVAPRRRRPKKSPTPPKRRRSPSPHHDQSGGEKARRHKRRKKKSSPSPSSSSSSHTFG